MALFIVSIASVSASDASDINDNQDIISVDDESVNDNLLSNNLASSDSNSDLVDDSGSVSKREILSSSGSSESSKLAATATTKKATTISSSTTKVVKGDAFSVTLKDKDGKVLSNKTLIFTVNGKDYNKTTNTKGVASLRLKLNPSIYLINVKFKGDSSYKASSFSKNVTVAKVPTTVVSSTSKVVSGDVFSVTLNDKNGDPLTGKKLIFTFNGKNYTNTTDSSGVAGLNLNAKPSKYLIDIIFKGDTTYVKSSLSTNVTVSKIPTTIANASSSAINGKSYSVVLKDKNGKALSSKKVVLKFNGKTYNVNTTSKGIASITITGTVAKTYNLTYSFAGDSYYLASSGSKSLKVKMPTKIVGSDAYILKGTKFNATLKDSNGKALASKTVILHYNGKVYNKTTNSKGIVTITPSPTPGKYYNITYNYAGSSYYGACSRTLSVYIKTPTNLTNSGSSVGQGTSYYVTLKDYTGKALANKTVTLTYRGNTYKKTTNAKGVVGLKITKGLGYTYKLTYKYAGSNYFAPSSGSVNIKVKKATTLTGPASTKIIKGNAYKVTLKDSDGKLLAGQKITFTFNGKVYNRTTNSKGVANLTIKAAAGKTYKLSYKFPGTSYYNRSSSKTINLAVKMKTSFSNSGNVIMNNTVYNVTLKDSDGNPLVDKLVKITFGNITYKRTTDANGIAGLLIKPANPKTVNLTYKFVGDTKYEPSSGSVSLDIKSDKIFRFKDIVNASSRLRTYVEKNHKLLATIEVNGYKMNITSFAYLLAKAVDNVNSNKTSNIALVDVKSNYSNSGNSSINGKLTKAQYIKLSDTLASFIESNGRVPYYITTTIGKVSPNLYIFGLSKTLDFYSDNNRLPNSLTLNAKDVGEGSSSGGGGAVNGSQFKKGLNEAQELNSTQLAQYLKASGNDALNAAIKELAEDLTAGKTTVLAKAKAIFNWVRDNIDYEYYADTKYKATGTLSKKRGNCCDHANLIVALCRAAEIPARFSHGKNCVFSSGLNTGHVWAQIYVDGVWYSADATSSRNEFGNIKNWNTNSFTLKGQYVHLSF